MMSTWAGESYEMLRYRARAGIVDTLFNKSGDITLLLDFFKEAFEASEGFRKTSSPSRKRSRPRKRPQPFRILDSFFTTLREGDLIKGLAGRLVEAASIETPVQILLANPFGDFARARWAAIKTKADSPESELKNGLTAILEKLCEHRGVENPNVATFQEALYKINAQKDDTHLEVRVHDVAPSGPMFIFPPFLLYGRFCSHKNSNALPWNLIIQDPGLDDDLFGTYESEFSSIWEKASVEPRESVDIVFITALSDPEGRWVKAELGDDVSWETVMPSGQSWETGTVKCFHEEIGVKVAIGSPTDMGMTSAAVVTANALITFRPRLVVMCGVCAAVEKKANLGDVVVGKHVYDYGSGKYELGRLTPDYRPLRLDYKLEQICQRIAADTQLLGRIKNAFRAKKNAPETELKVRIGPMASGAAVVADDDVVHELKRHMRSLVGIDMEGYGVMQAVHAADLDDVKAIVVKAAQDFANPNKDDAYREYAAYVSAAVAREIVRRYLQHFRS
jgi:nucleoside phosphorylase